MLNFMEKRLCGFSLSEMLITLTIIAILAVGSVPVLTKKKPKKDVINHGSYICYRTTDGTYHWERTENNNKTSGTSYGSCIFTTPTAKIKSYSVKLIGGGGGGAAGTLPKPKVMYSSGSVRVDEDGEYTVALIAGGGGGGTQICGSTSKAGGSGGYIAEDVMLYKNNYYYVTVGRGSSNIHNAGGSTTFTGDGYNITASGGRSGNWRVHREGPFGWGVIDKCKWGDGNGGGGSPAGVAGSQTEGRCGQSGLAGTISNERINNLTNNTSKYYGRGGAPCYAGNPGVASVSKVSLGSGGAGRPGEAIVKTFTALPSQVNITLGMGGSGGSYNGASGYAGGVSRFGSLLTANGGIGGDTEYIVNRTATAPGQNANVPALTKVTSINRSYGGFTVNNSSVDARAATMNGYSGAGSGGSGGGAAMGEYGNGAKGMPGAVIVEW